MVRGRSNFVGVFARADATWRLKLQRPGWSDEPSSEELVFRFGEPGSDPVVGDWNGDGAQTPGTFRAGTWSITNTLGSAQVDASFVFGADGDTPLAGDWDGDGRAGPGVYRDGVFRLRNELGAGPPDLTVHFGNAGDRAVVGDWDGDGVDTVGVYRPSDSTFHLIDRHDDGADVETLHVASIHDPRSVEATQGGPGASAWPVVGDWDEDGVSTVGVRVGRSWRLGNERLEGAPRSGEIALEWGDASAVAVVGNWRPDADRGFPEVPASLQELYPLAADFQPPASFAKWKQRGINTVVRVEHPVPYSDAAMAKAIEDFTNEANRLDLKMIREPRNDPTADNGEERLLAFQIRDEPELGPNRIYPEPVFPYLERVAASLRDPRVTQRPVFFNFAGSFILDPADDWQGPGDFREDLYSPYVALQDWVSQDVYPAGQLRARAMLGEEAAMAALPVVLDKLRRWAPRKPQFAYIEASQSDSSPLAPALTPGQLRAQIWVAIIHGARGIWYFPHGQCELDCSVRDAMTNELVAEMMLQNAHVTTLAPALQAAIDPRHFSVTAARPLHAGWRDHQGQKLALVANNSARSVQRWVRLNQVAPTMPIEVLFEGRTVELEPGTSAFLEEFEPYEVHLYRLR